MIPLAALLASLALALPFPQSFIDAVQVQVNVEQVHPGWLGYACHNCLPPVINLEPQITAFLNRDDLLRTTVAHEAYHLYYGGAYGTPTDPNDERGAYAFGCAAQWVPLCGGWLGLDNARPAP